MFYIIFDYVKVMRKDYILYVLWCWERHVRFL